jgi:2-methylcitrate dehydratase PrpD
MAGTRVETIADKLADVIAATDTQDLPASTRAATTVHALDTLGCALAAYGLGRATFVREAYAGRQVSGPATAIGTAYGLPATWR